MRAPLAIHPAAELFPLLESEDYEKLKADIAENGLRESIWIDKEGRIVDGRNRYRAWRELHGDEPIPYRYVPEDTDLVPFVVSLNVHRRHLSSSQRAALAVEIEKQLAEEAKERQRAHGDTAPGRSANTSATNCGSEGEAREQAAKLAGTNRQYVSDAKLIAAASPELLDEVKSGEKSIPVAKRQLSRTPAVRHAAKGPPLRAPEPSAKQRGIDAHNQLSHHATNVVEAMRDMPNGFEPNPSLRNTLGEMLRLGGKLLGKVPK